MVARPSMMSSTPRSIAFSIAFGLAIAAAAEAQVPSQSESAPSLRARDSAQRCSPSPARKAPDRDAAFAILCPDSVDLAPIHDLTDLLSARIPSVYVQETSGTLGTAARIRIRGSGSIEFDSEPLVILDGTRVLATPVPTSVLGPQLPSRLDDLRVEDIETIEVLRGPATAALYGVGAAGGVIRITTKRGIVGKTRLSVFAEGGGAHEVTRFPTNYRVAGISRFSGQPTNCGYDPQSVGACTPVGTPPTSFNALEEVSPFRTGQRENYGASISGGYEAVRYHGGAGFSRESGVYDASDLARTHVRLNLDIAPLNSLRIALSSAYLDSDAHFPKGESAPGSILYNGLLGNGVGDSVNDGYLNAGLSELAEVRTAQRGRRIHAGATAEWEPLAWLKVSVLGGIDRTDTHDTDTIPHFLSGWGDAWTDASLDVDKKAIAATAAASWSIARSVRASSRIGVERDETDYLKKSRTDRFTSPNFSTSSFTRRSEAAVTGFYLDQRFSWQDRLSASAGLRRDEYGPRQGDAPNPISKSASVSWLTRPAPPPGRDYRLGAVRLHLAYGKIGGMRISPDTPLLDVYPVHVDEPNALEQTAELEAGVAASLLGERLRVVLSWYDKTTTGGFALSRNAIGGPSFISTDATIENTGIEAMLEGTIVDYRPISMTVDAGVWTNSNTVSALDRRLWADVPGGWQQHVEGYPLAGYWHRPIVDYQDLNGDGLITRVNCPGQVQVAEGPACEITVGDQPVYLGRSTPKLEAFVGPKVTILRRIELSALIDYRSGFKQFNATELIRCMRQLCRGAHAGAPLAEQARSVARSMGAGGGFVEDATFARLREATVSAKVPDAWTALMGGTSATLTLAGRNLATWTSYSGPDPEVNGIGPLRLGQWDVFTQPPTRHYTVRLSLGW